MAKSLRANPTPAEKALWNALRSRRLAGHKFRRQHIISGFIADFYCCSAKLVLEVDGGSHIARSEYDAHRDQIFAALGLKVLRLSNDDVLDDLPSALRTILAAL